MILWAYNQSTFYLKMGIIYPPQIAKKWTTILLHKMQKKWIYTFSSFYDFMDNI